MDTDLERQVIRVLGAFQRAADKHWGPEFVVPKARPETTATKPDNWRSECPTRQRIRKMLQENPFATNQELIEACVTSKHVVTEVRKEFGSRCPRKRGYDNRKRIAAALDANPSATGAEIARLAGVGERYAQDVIKRLRWESSQ